MRAASAALALGMLAAGCGPRVLQLHPLTGDTFTLGHAMPAPPPPLGPFEGDEPARFDQVVTRWRERLDAHRSPGGAVAVVMDGQLRYAAGVGTREIGRDAPVIASTRFRTASITKMLVAAAIASLVDAGQLQVDRPLVALVPTFRRGAGFDASAVTIAMLLDHTSGIPDSVHCPDGAPLDDTIAMHADDPFWSPPGRLFDYSNANYALLAAVLEAVDHRPFQDIVAARVLAPAGMTTASFVASEDEDDLARGHVGGRVVWTHPVDCEASQAAGGVIASVIDYAHFAEALLAGGGSVLSPERVTQMTTGRALARSEPVERYGWGLVETERAGLRTIEHGGAAAGFTSIVRLVPERGFAVVVFTNGTQPPDFVADAAESALLDVPESSAVLVPAPPERWLDYVGHYDDTTGALGPIDVYVDGDALRARFDAPRGNLPPLFAATFERDPDGSVAYLVTRGGVAARVR